MTNLNNKIVASLGLFLFSTSALSDFGSWTRNKGTPNTIEEVSVEPEPKPTTPEIKTEHKTPVEKPIIPIPPERKPLEKKPPIVSPITPEYTRPTFAQPEYQPNQNSQLQREEELELSKFHSSMATMNNISSQKNIALTAEHRIALSVLNATLMQAEFDSSAQSKSVYTQAIGCINSFNSSALNGAAQQLVNSKSNSNASKIIFSSPSVGSTHIQKCAYQQ